LAAYKAVSAACRNSRIVEILEVVEIEHRDAQRGFPSTSTMQLARQTVFQVAPVFVLWQEGKPGRSNQSIRVTGAFRFDPPRCPRRRSPDFDRRHYPSDLLEVVEFHGGTSRVESRIGERAKYLIRIPG
jgi:hypothetical protein